MNGLYRPRHGRVIAGVCAGLAQRFGMAPWTVRLLALLSCLPSARRRRFATIQHRHAPRLQRHLIAGGPLGEHGPRGRWQMNLLHLGSTIDQDHRLPPGIAAHDDFHMRGHARP